MGKVKLFPSQTYDVKQPPDQVVCRTPSNGILCAPSASGKTVLLVSMILQQYRGCFERIGCGGAPGLDMSHRTAMTPTRLAAAQRHSPRFQAGAFEPGHFLWGKGKPG